jgi:hypothetical protein
MEISGKIKIYEKLNSDYYITLIVFDGNETKYYYTIKDLE